LFVVNVERCCAGGRQLYQNQHSEQAEALIVEQFIPKQENITESSQGNRPADVPAAPDSKSMSGSVPLRRLLTFVDKGIVKPKCPRNVTAAKKFH